MLNPLALPNDLIAALHSVANIERILDERLDGLERRFDLLDARMSRLPDDIEGTLRRHFEGQRGDLSTLHEELVANREQAELLPGKVDGLRAEVAGLRGEMGALLAEVSEVRETVEPLQGPAERAARLSERLPGGG